MAIIIFQLSRGQTARQPQDKSSQIGNCEDVQFLQGTTHFAGQQTWEPALILAFIAPIWAVGDVFTPQEKW